MSAVISQRIGSLAAQAPQGQRLRVLPILGPSADEPAYRLLDEQTLPQVQVTEISEGGSVPELRVHNALDVRLFLMDGQELLGAKQNRILNTDVLVPAGGTLSIPVSCVEAHRWHYASPSFSPGKTASHRVRSGKQARVHDSLKRETGHDADQGAVWDEVAMSLCAAKASSPTSALHAAYEARTQELAAFRQSLRMPEAAVGLAVFHDGRFQGLDLFDRHSTLVYFWESLVDSYAIDWLDAPLETEQPQRPEQAMVQEMLARAAAGGWEVFPSPGEGQDHRLEDWQLSGSALVWEGRTVVHLQLFPRPSGESAPSRRPRIHRPYGRPSGDIVH